MNKNRFMCLFLVIMLFFYSGCVKKKALNTSVRNYIVYNMEKLPDNLLMLDTDSIREQDFELLLFEGLVSTDAKGDIVPDIADKWTVTEDKLTYNFHIREGANWSDGNSISANDFVDFFSRAMREENSTYNNQLECIFGAKDYIDKKIDFNGVAISAKDDKNLEIKLNYPCSYFLEIISQPVFSLKKNFYNLRNWKTEYKKIIYTGPFIIEDIYGNGEIALKKNSQYWDNTNVLSNKLHVTNEGSSAFALAKYRSGEIDAFIGLPSSEIDNFNVGEKSIKGPISQGVSLNFNLNKEGIIQNINFRKIIKMSIDKNTIEEELKGILKKSSYYVPSNIKGANKEEANNTASSTINEQMKKELASIYKGENINLVYLNTDDNNKKIVDCITKNFKEINLNIKSQGYSEKELDNIVENGNYDMLLTNYIGKYDSPVSFLEQWASNSKTNIFGYKNTEFDTKLLKGKILSSANEAQNSLKQGESILLDNVAFIPIGVYNIVLCKKPYINGIEINKRGNVILKGINTSMKQENAP